MSIENTSLKPTLEWLGGLNPRAIERQEADGQTQLASSPGQLPVEGLQAVAASLGITVKGATNGDPLFADVELPAGWQIVPTEHAMWSELRDAAGVNRADIFYKAAFYDRRAFIRIHSAR